MNIGILKEAANIERRVALSPAGVEDLTSVGQNVYVLHQEGSQAIFRDEDYQIAGATIVASHASEMISELTTAMAAGVGLGRMAEVIHPYPTQAEAIRKVADAYNRTRLTPRVKRIFEALLAWRR